MCVWLYKCKLCAYVERLQIRVCLNKYETHLYIHTIQAAAVASPREQTSTVASRLQQAGGVKVRACVVLMYVHVLCALQSVCISIESLSHKRIRVYMRSYIHMLSYIITYYIHTSQLTHVSHERVCMYMPSCTVIYHNIIYIYIYIYIYTYIHIHFIHIHARVWSVRSELIHANSEKICICIRVNECVCMCIYIYELVCL